MSLGLKLQQWLFRMGRDTQLPIVLTQRRVFIIPSRTGLMFALVLIIMLLGAINYDLSLGHALVFLLAGIGLVGMVHTFRNLYALRLMPGHAAPVFAGEIAHFPVSIENQRSQPRRALTLCFTQGATVTMNIPPNDQARIEIPYQTSQRGHLDPGRITLATRYPLGLFYAWSYPHPPFSCLIYPKPITTPLPPSTPMHDHGMHQGESGQEDFTGLRQWQTNDSPKHIAWKAVARDIEHRPLLVKQFAGGAAEELLLDWALTPEGADMETRLSILTGWVLAAEQQHLHYGMRLPGKTFAPALGTAHRNACLEALALYA